MQAFEVQAELLKALAHPTRLHILEILAQEEACVCHLTTVIGQRQANISQHLMVLREAGLVQDRKDGVLVYYRLADQRISETIAMLREVVHIDKAIELPKIPPSPVPGCPCPKCASRGCAVK
jgi:ArsR family transcriptional regulator